MISPDHAQLMARYNRWQNESLYGAADKLSDGERLKELPAGIVVYHLVLLLPFSQSFSINLTHCIFDLHIENALTKFRR